MRTKGLSIPGAVGRLRNPMHLGDALLQQSHLKSRHVISYLITLPWFVKTCAPHWSRGASVAHQPQVQMKRQADNEVQQREGGAERRSSGRSKQAETV